MRYSVERHQVVFARGVEGNVLHQDKLFVVEVEGGGQDVRGVLVQAREHLGIGFGHALWRVLQPATVRVFTNCQQDLADSRFNARTVYLGVGLGARGGTVGGGEVVVVEMSHSRKLSRDAGGRCRRRAAAPGRSPGC
ncbi:hypothetical protein PJL18_03703 [Paenarthrobacter nicotinovorans]|nr:hypothetical protein [Paenarthrobacter nicotinovorans]